MNPTAMESEPLPRSDGGESCGLSEKRAMEVEEENGVGEMRPVSKRMKRAAEIVMMLSGMAAMRAGKSPTEVEMRLMEEAREAVADIVESVAAKPKDLAEPHAVKGLVEDLGLNLNGKDRGAVGFSGSKISIKDRFLLCKMKKVLDARKFVAPPGTYSSQAFKPSPGAVAENRGFSHQVSTPLPSGSRPASSAHVSAVPPMHVTHQLPASEVRASTAWSGSGTRMGKIDGASNGTSHAPQVQATGPPTWSIQPHSTAMAKSGPENKFQTQNPVKVEGTADSGVVRGTSQASRDQSFKPFTTQAASANLPNTHQAVQGAKNVQAPPLVTIHHEVGKIVQKLLYPKPPERPTLTPPSREYMNKLIPCQICRVPVNDVETVVLCDSCEKGFHLKCIDPNNRKAISTAEWHCTKCTALNNGKPFPPKYGRVMRSTTPLKVPPNQAESPSSLEKKVGSTDQKANQEKITVKGNSSLQSSSSSVVCNYIESGCDSKSNTPNAKEVPGNSVTVKEQEACTGTLPNNSVKHLTGVPDPSSESSDQRSAQRTEVSESCVQEERLVPESNLQPPTSKKTDDENSRPSKTEVNAQNEPSEDIVQRDPSKSEEAVVQREPLKPEEITGNNDYNAESFRD